MPRTAKEQKDPNLQVNLLVNRQANLQKPKIEQEEHIISTEPIDQDTVEEIEKSDALEKTIPRGNAVWWKIYYMEKQPGGGVN